MTPVMNRMQGMRPALKLVLRYSAWALAAVGLLAGGVALWQELADSRALRYPSVGVVALSSLLYTLGLVTYGRSWARLVGPVSQARSIQLRFIVSQPSKYVPGGFAQPIGQVAITAGVTGDASASALAFPSHVLINLASAGILASVLVVDGSQPAILRLLVLGGPLISLLLSRSVREWVLAVVDRLISGAREKLRVPEGNRPWVALRLALAAHFFMASAFGVLAVAELGIPFHLATGGYALAWMAGYAAIPFPAGVGVREAVLIALFSSTGPVGADRGSHRDSSLDHHRGGTGGDDNRSRSDAIQGGRQ